jgi:CRP-like cAMP-binding protein
VLLASDRPDARAWSRRPGSTAPARRPPADGAPAIVFHGQEDAAFPWTGLNAGPGNFPTATISFVVLPDRLGRATVEGPRSATITATSDLVCCGLTFWEFRPLVPGNGAIGWKLLESLAKMLYPARQE